MHALNGSSSDFVRTFARSSHADREISEQSAQSTGEHERGRKQERNSGETSGALAKYGRETNVKVYGIGI